MLKTNNYLSKTIFMYNFILISNLFQIFNYFFFHFYLVKTGKKINLPKSGHFFPMLKIEYQGQGLKIRH